MTNISKWSVLVLSVVMVGLLATSGETKPLKCMQQFKFQDFVIGTWWGPDANEEAYKLYKEAGFNVLMQASRGQLPDKELDLAQKVGLKVLIDTFTTNDKPWGGVQPPDVDPHAPGLHVARLGEMKWLQGQYGEHPALVGYLLNDNCGLHDYTVACAKYLLQTGSGLFPWMSTNPDPAGQAKIRAAMPILTTQNYPFLYQVNAPEPAKRAAFCNRLELDRVDVNRYDMCMWPFINTAGGVSPSQLRFQLFTSIAYGAQGIPYFTWHESIGSNRPGPLYYVAQAANNYVLSVVGPRVLGHRCIGVYHTRGPEMANSALEPGPGQVIEEMRSRLLAGVLIPEEQFISGENKPDYVMLVDKRTVTCRPLARHSEIEAVDSVPQLIQEMKEQEPAERVVRIKFGPTVKRVEVLGPEQSPLRVSLSQLGRNRVRYLHLKAGQGVLLKIDCAGD